MKKRVKKSIVIALAVFVASSVFSPLYGYAAYSPKVFKPEQVKALRRTGTNESSTTFKWNPVRKADGYEVFKDKKYLRRVKKSTFTDKKVIPGKKYSYKVRAYVNYKQKQYYNTKTKKWTAKKPARKHWKGKKTRYVKKRKYGSFSRTIKVALKAESPYAQQIPVLTFHRIASDKCKEENFKDDQWIAAVSDFEKQIQYLHDNNYKVISLREFEKWYDGEIEEPKKTVVLTFDDGDYEIYYQVYPILRKYGYCATSFVIGCVTDDETSEYIENEKHYIGRDLINIIRNEYPALEFQSHTYNLHHTTNDGQFAVDTKTYDELRNDFDLNDEFGFEYIAYPYGRYNDEMKRAAKDSGMRIAFAFWKYACATRNSDRYAMPRVKVNGQITYEEYVDMLNSYLE